MRPTKRPTSKANLVKASPAGTRPVRRAPLKIASAGANVFAALAKKTKFADPELIGHWPTIAGANLAALCRPGRITGMRAAGGRSLEVIAPNGAAAAETQMRADDLLTRVNRYLGPGAVARIMVRQSNKRPARNAPQAESPAHDPSPLGEALSSFRSAVARRNTGPGNADGNTGGNTET